MVLDAQLHTVPAGSSSLFHVVSQASCAARAPTSHVIADRDGPVWSGPFIPSLSFSICSQKMEKRQFMTFAASCSPFDTRCERLGFGDSPKRPLLSFLSTHLKKDVSSMTSASVQPPSTNKISRGLLMPRLQASHSDHDDFYSLLKF